MRQLRKMKKLATLSVFLLMTTLLLPFTATPVFAQATTGSLRGVVTDESGAVITDADITIRNTETGIESKTKSNSEGLYTFPRLAPGKYLMTVEKNGFKKQEFQGVQVNLGQDSTLDAALQAGQITETVTVTAGGVELLQKEQVQVSNTFESRKVVELPNNIAGGGIDTVALLAPGVIPGFGNVNGNGTTLSVNGQRARSNNFTVDGQDNNDLSIGGPNFFVTNSDAVGEFQIITNSYSAEFGRNQGGIINIATRAGTNAYHGTGFWAHRNRNVFDSMTNIERRTNNNGKGEPDFLINNVFSGTIGGPIQKDKLFIFGAYQYNPTRSEPILRSANPTIAREELARLRADFPNSAAVQALANFSAFAITDLGSVSERTDRSQTEFVTIGGRTYRVAYPQRSVSTPNDAHEMVVRGDYKINDRHSVWYRHMYQQADGVNALAGSGGFTGDIPTHTTLTGGNFTSQLSNSAVNEFRFVINRSAFVFGGGCEKFKGCITDPSSPLDSLTNLNFAGLRASGGLSLQNIGPATNLPQDREVRIYQFVDNLSKSMGRHQLKFGVDIRRLTNDVRFLPFINSRVRYNSAARLVANTPSAIDVAAGDFLISYNETDQYYYLQDDWRIKDNLTLNLGVRYEYTGQPINTLNDLTVARESNPQTALWRQNLPLEARTFGKLPADKNNFAPRLGFAWRPQLGNGRMSQWLFGDQDSTVISGGYSISYDPSFYNLLLNASTSSPTAFLLTLPAAATFALPSGTPTGANVAAAASAAGALRLNTYDPKFFNQTAFSSDFYSPYAQQWTLRVQREVTRNNVVEARYVGSKTTGLFQTLNRNPRIDRLLNGFTLGGITFPGFPNLVPNGLTPQVAGQGQCVDDPNTPINEANSCNGRVFARGLIRSRENTGTASYHGLQTEYRGRLFDQLNIGMAYTWSKAIDNASEVFSFFEVASPQNPFNINAGEKGLSGFDRRHAFSMNFIYDFPFMKDQKGILGKTLGGWQVNGTYFLANGQRYSVNQFCLASCLGNGYSDTAWDGAFVGALDSVRPFLGNPNAPRSQAGISQIDAFLLFGGAVAPVVDPNGFYSYNELNVNGRAVAVTRDQVRYIFNGPGAAKIFGTPYGIGRGSEVGPRLNNLNLGIFKNIRLTERVRFQFRADVFNALNHPNPGVGFITNGVAEDGLLDDAGTTFNERGEINFARRAIQLGMKIVF